MDRSIVEDAIEFVKQIFEKDYSGHDYFHTLRVYKTATNIAVREKADITIVQLAALLHDVDDRKLSPETCAHKDKAVAFLRAHHVGEDVIQSICDIISEISFAGTDSVRPATIEGQCVQDADRLDAIGAIGIARAFAYGGNRGRVIYDPDIAPDLNMNAEAYHCHESTTINHFYEKLLLIGDLMNTNTAKQIAEHREKYMREYVSEFLDEWEGIR